MDREFAFQTDAPRCRSSNPPGTVEQGHHEPKSKEQRRGKEGTGNFAPCHWCRERGSPLAEIGRARCKAVQSSWYGGRAGWSDTTMMHGSSLLRRAPGYDDDVWIVAITTTQLGSTLWFTWMIGMDPVAIACRLRRWYLVIVANRWPRKTNRNRRREP